MPKAARRYSPRTRRLLLPLRWLRRLAAATRYTLAVTQDGYMDDAGELVENETLVYEGIHAGEAEVFNLIDDIKKRWEPTACMWPRSMWDIPFMAALLRVCCAPKIRKPRALALRLS